MYISVSENYDPVGSKKITNRCPDCGTSDSLELTFYQKRIETSFSTKITKKVTGTLYCHNTKTEISPVQWNEEIQRAFDVEKQKVKLQPKSTKFNKWFYGLMIFLGLFFCGLVGFIAYENITANNLEEGIQNVSTGNKVEVMYTSTKSNERASSSMTWFFVKKIEADTIWVQRHKEIDTDLKGRSVNFDLDESNFTEEVFKGSLERFKDRVIMGHDYSKQQFNAVITNIKK